MVRFVSAALLPYTVANLLTTRADVILPNLRPVVALAGANYPPLLSNLRYLPLL